MNDKLKNCPFCGKVHQVYTYKNVVGYDENGIPIAGETREYVDMQEDSQEKHGFMISPEHFNNRPAEKYLRDWLEAIDSGLTLPAQKEIERLKARIAELEAQAEPDWIPVSVRLPECEKKKGAQSERVACLTNLFERTIGWVDWNTYIKGYTWDWVKNTIYEYSDEIIAWYPLPPVKVQP